MQELLDFFNLVYKTLSAKNIGLFILILKIFFCASGGLFVTYIHSKFSYNWLRNNFNLYVGMTLPIIGLVITTVIGSNIALSIGMIGALSIVRFRTPIRTPYELVHYFSLLTIGISAKVDLGVTFVLVILLSTLPYLIKKFSPINSKVDKNTEKLMLNFDALIDENQLREITNDKNLRNYSVKKENNNFNISGLVVFLNKNEKNKFLDKWTSKIKTYNVDLDEKS